MKRRSRAWLTAGAAVAALLALGGCLGSGDDKWKEPDKGQAEALLSTDNGHGGSSGAAWLAFDGDPDGLTVGPDGKVYGLATSLAVIEGHKARTILNSEVHGAGGLVVLSPNSFVVGAHAQLLNMKPGGEQTALAGVSGTSRKPGQPVPATTSAKTFPLTTGRIEPFGRRSDGSVLFADGDVIWRLKADRLTRLYQAPRNKKGKVQQIIDRGSAVDHSGTVYLRTAEDGLSGRLGDVVSVHEDGSVQKLALPKHVSGVKGNLASLGVTWMAGDGSNGVYVRARDESAGYVLHVTSGKAELVARQISGGDSDSGCKEGYSVDALKLPCTMPEALTYSAGSLIMAGHARFVLKIATK
ncbi:hypothetical protein ACIRPX_28780 [Streptomyces sp. NPDC101225]|uniref:hypothetical protein n=1 Tax=Streptomyces sp. NPDC101225 TaxID=3366135 RepID=UPI003813B4D7